MKSLTALTNVLTLATSVALLGPVSANTANDAGPELRLFSSTIVEDIKLTGDAAASMESDVQSSIQFMDLQLETYQAAGCDDLDPDPGCADMRRQLGQGYSEMLSIMDAALPRMSETINRSRAGLQRSLGKNLGRGMTPSDIQDMMLDTSAKPKLRRARQSGSGTRLSQRFAQYHQLVAGAAASGKRGRGALAVTASDIYLEMEEASELIALTRDEISRAQLAVDIDNALPGFTGQMEETVVGVKRILFGESEGQDVAFAPPVDDYSINGVTSDYKSPLEM